MNNMQKRILSFTLSLIMLLGMIPPMAVNATNSAVEAPASSKSALNAGYTTSPVTIDGAAVDQGWSLQTPVGDKALFGALWDLENLYIAISNPEKDRLTVTLNGIKLTVDNATIKSSMNKKNSEYAVSLAALGVTPKDFGTEISAKVKVGKNVWEGTIVLSGITWVTTETPVTQFPVVRRGSIQQALVDLDGYPTASQGSKKIMLGMNLYDLYNSEPFERNPRAVRSYVMYQDAKMTEALNDRSSATVFEFTFHANAMPVYETGYDTEFYKYIATCGFAYWLVLEDGKTLISMGITNTDAGLVFVVHSDNGEYSCHLGKEVGDTFRVGNIWEPDGDLVLYIDGVKKAVFNDVEYSYASTLDPNAITINVVHNDRRSTSEADNIDIDITSLALGKYKGENLLDSLTFDSIRRRNLSPDEIINDLFLASKHGTEPFSSQSVTWESSDPSVIDPTNGKITRPAEGMKEVTLTAKMEELGLSKEFHLSVIGTTIGENVLIAERDLATYDGNGEIPTEIYYTLDAKNNSIIRDLKEVKTVNVIALKDGDAITRLNESMLTIWVSNDNETYTQAENFKLLRAGEYTYLYDFEATGRYIKVHYTMHDTAHSDFTGPVSDMIDAYYQNVFGEGDGVFQTVSSVTVQNPSDALTYDIPVTVSPKDAGIKCLKNDKSDVRFYQNGKLLYHYYDGENYIVRVTDIPAGGTAVLNILSGNTSAMDISNKEYVYEVVYGTRETYSGTGQYLSLPQGILFSFVDGGRAIGTFQYRMSYDEGRTWTSYLSASGMTDYIPAELGDMYDENIGRIVVQGYRRIDIGLRCYSNFVYSDNLGRTWNRATLTVEGAPIPYTKAYSDMIKLEKSYDGEDGPGVDYVMAYSGPDLEGIEFDNPDDLPQEMVEVLPYVGRVAYSTDCGKSWIIGPSVIRNPEGVGTHSRESGLCETTVLEADDGTLLFLSRNQYDNMDHFAAAYSYDHGKTWTETATTINVYATNAQPILFKYDGAEMLLWGGNSALGGSSYRRYPLNVAVSYDNLKSFTGIQDLFSRTDLQGLITPSATNTTNPFIDQIGDAVILSFNGTSKTIRIDEFGDYFFKTKGAYDSFENTTPEYEGWAQTGGGLAGSTDRATDGETSMKFGVSASATRSIPSLSSGTISFDLWIDDVDKANLEIELESAYAVDFGKAAPVALKLIGKTITFHGSDKTATAAIVNGWNHFEFDIALDGDKQSVTLTVNGGDAIDAPIYNGDVNNYVCYVSINCNGTLVYYLDAFHAVDNDVVTYVKRMTAAEETELTEVPESLEKEYADTAALKNALYQQVLAKDGELFTAENSKYMNLTLKKSIDGGSVWESADFFDIPLEGIKVRLDYPEGTSSETHNFSLSGVCIKKSLRNSIDVGTFETPAVIEKEDGLYVTLSVFGPTILSWIEAEDPEVFDPFNPPSSAPDFPILWVGIGAAVALVAVVTVIIVLKKKKKSA